MLLNAHEYRISELEASSARVARSLTFAQAAFTKPAEFFGCNGSDSNGSDSNGSDSGPETDPGQPTDDESRQLKEDKKVEAVMREAAAMEAARLTKLNAEIERMKQQESELLAARDAEVDERQRAQAVKRTLEHRLQQVVAAAEAAAVAEAAAMRPASRGGDQLVAEKVRVVALLERLTALVLPPPKMDPEETPATNIASLGPEAKEEAEVVVPVLKKKAPPIPKSHPKIPKEPKSPPAKEKDPDADVRGWINKMVPECVGDEQSLEDMLQSGVILCRIANRMQPGIIRQGISESKMPFPRRENINKFIQAARVLKVRDSIAIAISLPSSIWFGLTQLTGSMSPSQVPEHSNFDTDDLFSTKNMKQVLICLRALGMECAQDVPGCPSMPSPAEERFFAGIGAEDTSPPMKSAAANLRLAAAVSKVVSSPRGDRMPSPQVLRQRAADSAARQTLGIQTDAELEGWIEQAAINGELIATQAKSVADQLAAAGQLDKAGVMMREVHAAAGRHFAATEWAEASLRHAAVIVAARQISQQVTSPSRRGGPTSSMLMLQDVLSADPDCFSEPKEAEPMTEAEVDALEVAGGGYSELPAQLELTAGPTAASLFQQNTSLHRESETLRSLYCEAAEALRQKEGIAEAAGGDRDTLAAQLKEGRKALDAATDGLVAWSAGLDEDGMEGLGPMEAMVAAANEAERLAGAVATLQRQEATAGRRAARADAERAEAERVAVRWGLRLEQTLKKATTVASEAAVQHAADTAVLAAERRALTALVARLTDRAAATASQATTNEQDPPDDYEAMRPFQLKAALKQRGLTQDGPKQALVRQLEGFDVLKKDQAKEAAAAAADADAVFTAEVRVVVATLEQKLLAHAADSQRLLEHEGQVTDSESERKALLDRAAVAEARAAAAEAAARANPPARTLSIDSLDAEDDGPEPVQSFGKAADDFLGGIKTPSPAEARRRAAIAVKFSRFKADVHNGTLESNDADCAEVRGGATDRLADGRGVEAAKLVAEVDEDGVDRPAALQPGPTPPPPPLEPPLALGTVKAKEEAKRMELRKLKRYEKSIIRRIEQADTVLETARGRPTGPGQAAGEAQPLQYVQSRRAALVEEVEEIQRMILSLQFWELSSSEKDADSVEGDQGDQPVLHDQRDNRGAGGFLSLLCSTGDFCSST